VFNSFYITEIPSRIIGIFDPACKTVALMDEGTIKTQNSKCCLYWCLKVHMIDIFFGFDFEICIISLLVMSKY
jgi:hypothetical protein